MDEEKRQEYIYISRWKIDVIWLSAAARIDAWSVFLRQGWATDGLCTCGLVTRLPLYTMVTRCSNLRAMAPMKYTAPPPFKRVAFLPPSSPSLSSITG